MQRLKGPFQRHFNFANFTKTQKPKLNLTAKAILPYLISNLVTASSGPDR